MQRLRRNHGNWNFKELTIVWFFSWEIFKLSISCAINKILPIGISVNTLNTNSFIQPWTPFFLFVCVTQETPGVKWVTGTFSTHYLLFALWNLPSCLLHKGPLSEQTDCSAEGLERRKISWGVGRTKHRTVVYYPFFFSLFPPSMLFVGEGK